MPPSAVETMQGSPAGVARVETHLSFTNQLVNILTIGIYTPMTIVVTCADGPGASSVTTKEEFETAITTGEPFLVQTHVE